MSGQEILLIGGTGSEVVTRNRGYTTSRSGVVIGYNRTGGSAVETLTAGIDGDADAEDGHGQFPDDCEAVPVTGANANDICGQAKVYWVGEADQSDDDDTYIVVHADVDERQIVVQEQGGGTTLLVVDYEDTMTGDVFDVNGEPGGRTYVEDLAAFESALSDVNDEDGYQLEWDQTVARRWIFNLITSS